ncbi:MAG: hypothetical protein HY537_11480 [Deltaproteobacteria bacterium]|nr:hypothetical protein [Deltaproteobacteria bacterium]
MMDRNGSLIVLAGMVLMFVLCAPHPLYADEQEEGRELAKKSDAKPSAPSRREEGDYVIEKRSDGTTIKYKKKTQYDFEGANIEGLYKRPSGSYISNVKDVKGKSIIRIRENFDAEVIDSGRILR